MKIWLTLVPLLAIAQTPSDVAARLQEWDSSGALASARRLVAAEQGSPSLAHAGALDLLGESLSLAGDPAALDVLTQAIQTKAAILPPGHPALAESHLLLAAEHALRLQPEASLTHYQSALALAVKQPGAAGEHVRHLALTGVGSALTALNRFEGARAAFDEALGVSEAECGAGSRSQRDVWRALSTLAYLKSDLQSGEEYLARSKSVREIGPVEAVQNLYLASGLAMERGRYDEAAAGYREVLAFQEVRLGVGNRRLIPVLRNLARCLRFQAKYQDSIATHERALGISVPSHGAQSAATAQLLGSLATAKAESGEFAEARVLYDRVLAAQIAALGPAHPQVSAELFSLANLEQVLGDFPNALSHAARAIEIREAVDGKESARTASMYSLLGRVHALNGDLRKGRELAELAVAIGRRTVGDAHPRTVYARSDLGEVLYLSGRIEEARANFALALDGQAKLFGEDSVRTAQSQYNLGLAGRAMGRHAEALDCFSRASRIWKGAFGPDYPLLAETLAGEAASLAALGRPAEALAPALESARVRRLSLAAVALTAAEREALLYARVDRNGLALAVDVAATGALDEAGVRAVWDAVIRDRGFLLDAAVARRQLSHQGAAAAALGDQVSRLKSDLARAALVADPRVYATRIAALREQIDRAERQLGLHGAPRRREAASTRAGFAEVTSAVPADAALVGYTRSDRHYVAFVWRRAPGRAVAIRLGTTGQIEALTEAWRAEIERERTSAGRNARRNEAAYRAAGLALRRAVWDPLGRQLGAAATVFVALDGALQLVNLDALPATSGRYLAETGPLRQILTSERDIFTTSRGAKSDGGLLALGDPALGLRPRLPSGNAPRLANCPDLEDGSFAPLPASGDEASAVARLWAAGGGESRVLRGGEASESSIRSLAAGRRVLHLATHGFFLTPGCGLAREAALQVNPLLRAGLVLAPAASGQDDGLLTAEEVSTLDLQSAQLVVLSGCDTARGLPETGEGLLGLRWAFHAAGARYLVSSLWPVEDVATRNWMLTFYSAYLRQGASIAQAVRVASRVALRQRRQAALSTHPFYWAGFLASGR